jgi:hypothetical protein
MPALHCLPAAVTAAWHMPYANGSVAGLTLPFRLLKHKHHFAAVMIVFLLLHVVVLPINAAFFCWQQLLLQAAV